MPNNTCKPRQNNKVILLSNNMTQWIKMTHPFRELTERTALNQTLTLLQKDHTFLNI